MPAHAASWGKGFPDLTIPCPLLVEADDGATPAMREHGVDRVALHPLRNSTFEFLREFFESDVFAAFPSRRLHVGGDEVNAECWAEDPEVKQWAVQHGGPDWARELQGQFERRVMDMLAKAGKRPVAWDEVLDGVSMGGDVNRTKGLPRGSVIQWWRGWSPDTPQKSANAGVAGLVWSAPWYLDRLGDDWVKMYKAEIPAANGWVPLLGGEACMWSEHADSANVEDRVFSRLPAIAERLWSSAEATAVASSATMLPTTARRLARFVCRLRQQVGIRVSGVYAGDFCADPKEAAEGTKGGRESGVALLTGPRRQRKLLENVDSISADYAHRAGVSMLLPLLLLLLIVFSVRK
jgi:hexosaminidase